MDDALSIEGVINGRHYAHGIEGLFILAFQLSLSPSPFSLHHSKFSLQLVTLPKGKLLLFLAGVRSFILREPGLELG